ncbi:hypothetical protein ACOBV8_15995 [Pseudoalteromonas espejiana]
MLIAMVMSLVSFRTALNGMTGEISLIGIFGSKKLFSCKYFYVHCISTHLLSLNKTIDRSSRILGVVLLITSTLVLIKAKSLGAMVFVLGSILICIVIIYYQNLALNKFTRGKLNWSILLAFLTGMFLLVYSLINGSFNELMYSIGKILL